MSFNCRSSTAETAADPGPGCYLALMFCSMYPYNEWIYQRLHEQPPPTAGCEFGACKNVFTALNSCIVLFLKRLAVCRTLPKVYSIYR